MVAKARRPTPPQKAQRDATQNSKVLQRHVNKVWNAAAMFLLCRLQGSEPEKPGRSPDMSVRAAFAMKAVLHEVGAM